MLQGLLWNVVLTAGLAPLLVVLGRLAWLRRRPALRQGLWLLLLAKLVTPSLIGVPLLPAVANLAVPSATPVEPLPLALVPSLPEPIAAAVPSPSGQAGSETGEAVPRPGGSRSLWWAGLLIVSLSGTGLFVAVHGIRAAQLLRQLKHLATEHAALTECCAQVAACLGIRGRVRSCVVEVRTTPLLCTWRQPTVVVPRALLERLSPQQLRGIVAHELAHLLRRDPWTNTFVFLVKALLWWNPVVWWADRELRAAQELCCDAIAIDCCGVDRRGYATTLLQALDFLQAEPWTPRVLAAGMGSRVTFLRRFEMLGEKRLSYRLSRSMVLLLLAFGISLACMPVRAQEKAAPAAVSQSEGQAAKPEAAKSEPAKAEATKAAASAETPTVDPETKALGEAVSKRLSAWSDVETLTLKDGQTALMKVKPNVTPVTQILITAHLVEQGTRFDLEGIDANGKTIEGTKITSVVIHDAQAMRMGLGKTFPVDGKEVLAKIQLSPTRHEGQSVAVEVKALFTPLATPAEIRAMLLAQGKEGRLQLDFQDLNRWIYEYRQNKGVYPKTLAELNQPLPKDVYSPTCEPYHYEPQRTRYILSSCGQDGIYGNADDVILISSPEGTTTAQRHELYRLEEEKAAKATPSPEEMVLGVRPQGTCSLQGKAVSAATGEPIAAARIYLHYNVTHGSIFVRTASDGSFLLKDLPQGPFSLLVSHTAGYQDASYNPDDKPGPYPPFSLKEGEQREGIVLKAKPACRVMGKVVDEHGKVPTGIDTLSVLAWFEKEGGEEKRYENQQANVNRADGTYVIDGLSDKPVYVMAINWRAAQQGTARPPIYYPSTFFRDEAKPIRFEEGHEAKNIEITLRNEGGLVLEGTVRDESGAPVPEAFVVADRPDMLFDFVTAYTDAQGYYRLQGLGNGALLVHVDAVQRGFVRTRDPLVLDKGQPTTQHDFTLLRGATISGKLVDEKGNDWPIGRSYGSAFVSEEASNAKQPEGSFSLTAFRNKYRPTDVENGSGGSFSLGEGPYRSGDMIFTSQSTFVIQGMLPGRTKFQFLPQKEGQKVLQILHDGQDIQQCGLTTQPGQEVKDVTIVIGAK